MNEKPYKSSVSEVRTFETINNDVALIIEGYAMACMDFVNHYTPIKGSYYGDVPKIPNPAWIWQDDVESDIFSIRTDRLNRVKDIFNLFLATVVTQTSQFVNFEKEDFETAAGATVSARKLLKEHEDSNFKGMLHFSVDGNNKPYTTNVQDLREREYLGFREGLIVEGYALGLDDITYLMTGESNSDKRYDPMYHEGDTLHSYAFDMKDGGRHHSIKDYKNISEICQTLLRETVSPAHI